MERVRGPARRRSRWWSEEGQAFSEWVVITGLLVLIGLAVSAVLQEALKTMVQHAVHAVGTIAP